VHLERTVTTGLNKRKSETSSRIENVLKYTLPEYVDEFLMFKNGFLMRGNADKSLARPGRKQATATKLWIYSKYSPRSSIHFLTHCCNFCKPLKKESEGCPSNQVRSRNYLRVGQKMATFQLIFQSREQVVVRRGQIRRIGWVIKTLEALVGQFLLGCKCPVSQGIFVQQQDPLGDFPVTFFLQNVLQLYHQK